MLCWDAHRRGEKVNLWTGFIRAVYFLSSLQLNRGFCLVSTFEELLLPADSSLRTGTVENDRRFLHRVKLWESTRDDNKRRSTSKFFSDSQFKLFLYHILVRGTNTSCVDTTCAL